LEIVSRDTFMTKAFFVSGLTLLVAVTFTVVMPARSFAQVNGGNGAEDTVGGGGGGGGGFGGGSAGGGANGGGNGGNGVGGNAAVFGGGGAGVGGGGGGFGGASPDGSPGSGTIAGLTNTGTISGGSGVTGGGGGAGIGGGGGDPQGGGRGGDAGFTITNSTINNSGNIFGGAGGSGTNNGGFGGDGIGNGGAGGDSGGAGGAGLNGLTIINSGTIRGGDGGNGGATPSGAGGVGIAGSNMTIVNQGTISGGMSGDGATRADAITFSGGTNALTLSSGGTVGTLTGGIGISGSLSIDPGGTSSVTLANVIHDGPNGAGSLTVTGNGTLTLTGTNTYTGGTSIFNGSTVIAGSNDAFGTGTIHGFLGTIGFQNGINVANVFDLEGPATNFNVASGTATYSGHIIEEGDPATLVKTGAGTLIISNNANSFSLGARINDGVLQVTVDHALGLGTITLSGGTLQAGANVSLSNLTIDLAAPASTIDTNGFVLTYAGVIEDAAPGSVLTKTGAGTLLLTGTQNSFANVVVNEGALRGGAVNAFSPNVAVSLVTAGSLDLGGFNQTIGSLAGDSTGVVTTSGGAVSLTTGNAASTTFAGTIQDGAGTLALNKVGAGVFTLAGTNTYTGGTTINGGTLQIGDGGMTGSILGSVTDNATLAFDRSNAMIFSGVISGSGAVNQIGAGTTTLTAANAYTGGTMISGGTLALSGVGTLGAGTGSTAVNVNGTLDLGGTTQTQSAVNLAGGTIKNGALNAAITSTGGTLDGIGGTASLSATGGTTVINGTNTFTGGTTVTNATLTVNGSLSDPTIGPGGLLNGTGSVGDTMIQNGGIFAPGSGTPGSSMTVAGSLALQSGAMYVVMLNPTTASFANVTGTATLNGATVSAIYANGSYISKQYTILTAGSISGTFGSLVNSNLPANFTTSLSYDPTHAFLNLALNFTGPKFGGGLNVNQQNVANALTNFFNATGNIPMVFGTLTPAGLTQASGELATGSQQATFDAMNLFMGLMTDPFVAGRGDGATSGAGAPTGYASTQTSGAAARDAYAMFTKAPPAAFEPRWSVWAAGYGGSQTTDGNAALGSNSTTSSVAGTVVGADYRISPNTLAGFALAGGGTGFSVAGSGSGHSDLFQAGAFIRHTVGPAYISAALAYGWQDITTNRTVTAAGIDQLRAEFNANAFSGRLEGGYRFVSPWAGGIGLTPYAAAQFTTFDLPAYAEQATVGSNAFALAYNAKDVTDERSELGIRTDKSWAMPGAILTLRSRFAWAHDFDPDRSIAATFQTLPGASFVVNGAAQARDSALTTASVEMKWVNGWSAAATFEGEFSNVTSSYAGKGVVRYQW
jgi:autotransporter-associated beta strand protein